MHFPGRKSQRTGDPAQPETSKGPIRGADEATEDEFDALASDVFGTSAPSQDNDGEQAASPDSSEEVEASTRIPPGSESLDSIEDKTANGSPETSSPSLSRAPIDYDAESEDQSTTETKELPEDQASAPRVASSNVINVQDRISETLEDIFQKKVVTNPLLKALLEMHDTVDLRELAAELGEFAINIGASKRRN